MRILWRSQRLSAAEQQALKAIDKHIARQRESTRTADAHKLADQAGLKWSAAVQEEWYEKYHETVVEELAVQY